MDDRRTFGGILGTALEVYGQRFWTFFAIALVGQFLLTLGGTFLSLVSREEPTLNNAAVMAAGVAAFLVGLIPYAMQVPAMFFALAETHRGRPVTIGQAFDRASARLTWEAFWANLIAGWLTVGGVLLGVVPGIVFGVWFCLSDVVVVLEGERNLGALRRSQRLVKGHGGKALALLLVSFLMAALTLILNWLLSGHPGAGLLWWLMGVVVAPFQYALRVLLYFDLRARQEAGAPHDGAASEEAGP